MARFGFEGLDATFGAVVTGRSLTDPTPARSASSTRRGSSTPCSRFPARVMYHSPIAGDPAELATTA